MRDYSPWEGPERDSNVAFLKPFVWDCMLFERVYADNYRHAWMIDPSGGIESIASFVAHAVDDDETYTESKALRYRHTDCEIGDEECRFLYEQGMGFINCVFWAILQLIDDGQVEIALESGWPVIRLTLVNLPEQVLGGSDVVNERETRMRKRVEELGSMPYAEYLQSEEWRFRRSIHLEAAGNRCQLCNSDQKPLHVHHRTYANRGRERFYDLVVLCPPCHEAFHKSGRRVGW